MPTLLLDDLQIDKVNDLQVIESPTNREYLKETERNNIKLQEKINEYAEAYKNASSYFVK